MRRRDRRVGNETELARNVHHDAPADRADLGREDSDDATAALGSLALTHGVVSLESGDEILVPSGDDSHPTIVRRVARPRKMVFAVMAFAVMAAAVGVASAVDDSPTLTWNKQIGGIHLRERKSRVLYTYGTGSRPDCGFASQNCTLPDMHAYRVQQGRLWVSFFNRNPREAEHVVYLVTNSPFYETKGAAGVGTEIPYGHRWKHFRWHNCKRGPGFWLAGTSWSRPLWKHPTRRWWTRLYMDRGKVKWIVISRGDFADTGPNCLY